MYYPVVAGLDSINFISEEGFYTPSSLGNWPTSDALLQKELLYEQKVTHLGFAIPKEKGKYKLKIFIK
jgi:hypothetical protein